LNREFGKARYQFDRKVIHAVVTEIFKGFQSGGFSGTAHAGDDDELCAVRRDLQITLSRQPPSLWDTFGACH
jgi:hypothetical protein